MDEMVDLMVNVKTLIPNYVRIPRVMRDIPNKFIVAGCKDLALRSALKKRMEEIGIQCNCIRCREYGHRLRDGWKIGEPHLERRDYNASGGNEVFLSYDSVISAKSDTSLSIGDTVETLGFEGEGDNGGATYLVVAGGTGTDDGILFIDMDNGNQL